jgi:hypothetical protein
MPRPVELPVVHLQVLEAVLPAGDARHHRQEVLDRPELLHLSHLDEEILERELRFQHLLGCLARLVLVDRLLGLLDQRGQHVPHPEDPREAIRSRVERPRGRRVLPVPDRSTPAEPR